MVKYHVNGKGEPGICSAQKSCPFGDLDTEHYSNASEAMEAYEKSMESSVLPKPLKTLDDWVREKSNLLVKLLVDDDGNFVKPDYTAKNIWRFDPGKGEHVIVKSKSEPLPGFDFINSGIEVNVYREPESDLVYKVPNNYSDDEPYSFGNEINYMAQHRMNKKAYDKIDEASLRRHNIRYAETHFVTVKDMNGHRIPVTVQEYLPPEDYEKHDLSSSVKEELTRDNPLSDLHNGNVWKNKKTGEIVLFDCLKLVKY